MPRHFATMRSLGFIAALVAPVYATCYYPDGSDAAKDYNYQPCGNTAFSTCCYFGEGDKCLDNGLCSQGNKPDYRAACANKDWSNCPDICMGEQDGTWYQLQKCGDNKYCCPPADESDCCNSGATIYTLPVKNSTTSSDSTSNSSGSTSTSGSSSNSNSGTSSNDGTTTVVVTSTAGGNSVPAGPIAGGVVGGVFVIGLFVFGFIFFKRKGKKGAASASPENGGNDGGSGAGGGPALVSSPSDGRGSSNLKSIPQPSVAEVEGQLGKKWNEADSKPVLYVSPTLGDEKLDFFSQATTPSPVQHHAGLTTGGAVEADSNPVITHTVQPPRTPTLVQQLPVPQYAAEVDGGATTTSSGSSVSSAHAVQPATQLGVPPVQQMQASGYPVEMDGRAPMAAVSRNGSPRRQGSPHSLTPNSKNAYTHKPMAEIEGTVVMQTALGPIVSTTIEQSYAPASSITTRRSHSTRRAAEMDNGAVARRTPSPANSTSTLGRNGSRTGRPLIEADSSPFLTTPVRENFPTTFASEAYELNGQNAMATNSYVVTDADSDHLIPPVARQNAPSATQQTASNQYTAEMDGGILSNNSHNNGAQTQATRHAVEADGRVIMEADSRPTGRAPIQHGRVQTTITSTQNASEMDSREILEMGSDYVRSPSREPAATHAVEVDSRALLEADSNPVMTTPPTENARHATTSSEQQKQAHKLS